MTAIKELRSFLEKLHQNFNKPENYSLRGEKKLCCQVTIKEIESKLISLAKKDRNFSKKFHQNVNEIIFDMLDQCCGNEEGTEIDNHCMSCYEHACEYLTKEGWLEEINSRMYKVVKQDLEDVVGTFKKSSIKTVSMKPFSKVSVVKDG